VRQRRRIALVMLEPPTPALDAREQRIEVEPESGRSVGLDATSSQSVMASTPASMSPPPER